LNFKENRSIPTSQFITDDSLRFLTLAFMNIEHLRKTLKAQWLHYYRENRSWLTRLGIWVNCEGKRRPSSSFILGTLTTLEPQLLQILPLVVDLSSNPDRIILALGLNFNPDEELEAIAELDRASARSLPASKVAMLPNSQAEASVSKSAPQPKSVSELRSAQSSDPFSTDAPPAHPPNPDPLETQVTVPVRKIVDPPEPSVTASRAKPQTSAKQASSKPPGVPLSGVSLSGVPLSSGSLSSRSLSSRSDLPSDLPAESPNRFPANGTLGDRLTTQRPQMDTAILSAGQLPDRDTSDLDSPPTAQSPNDART
jgi:Family of unknown function (DUF5331)